MFFEKFEKKGFSKFLKQEKEKLPFELQDEWGADMLVVQKSMTKDRLEVNMKNLREFLLLGLRVRWIGNLEEAVVVHG